MALTDDTPGAASTPADEPALIHADRIGLQIRTVKQKTGEGGNSFVDLVRESLRSRATIFKRDILKDLTFTLNRGDRVGLIGANGAGKSTLLFVLNGAMASSSGKLTVNGSTHALMNVRLGMKIRATGIENIYLNGYRLGHSANTIRELTDEIIEFSELGTRIYEPIQTYSAGMQLRLAFAIATSIKPDILLMDEWVGAGDRRFRHKAQERLNGVLAHSRGMVIASHSEHLIRSVCNKVLYLDNGEMRFFGDLDTGYEMFNADQAAPLAKDGAAENPG